MLKELPTEITKANGSVWHPIAGWYYADSETGRIFSQKTQRWLSGWKTHNDYWQVFLRCEEGPRQFLVHRLIWETFNGEIPKGYEVNHINEDKADNRLSNLSLMTHKENSNYGTRNARVAAANTIALRNHPDISKKVYQYSLDGELVNVWPSTAECGRNGFNEGAIAACCRGCYSKQGDVYKGFKWSYQPLENKKAARFS